MGGPRGNLRVALGFLWVLHGETPGEPEDFLRFSLAAQALGEPKDSLGFSLGAPLGGTRRSRGSPHVFARCSLRRPEENLMVSLRFRLVLPGGTSGTPMDFFAFSLGAP